MAPPESDPTTDKPTEHESAKPDAEQASSRVRRGVAAAVGAHVYYEGSRLISNLILVRLLDKSDFGMMLLVNVVLRGVVLFSDIGIGANIIQSRKGADRDFLNTAWTIQIIRGVLLFGIAVGLSGPVAKFYEEPLLEQLIPATALTVLITGFLPTKMHTASRNLQVARLAAIDVATHTVGIGTLVLWAYLAPSVWALVWAGVVGRIAELTFNTLFVPGPGNRLLWVKEHAADILRFGRWILLSTALAFAASELDALLLGKFLTTSELGVYSIALALSRMPRMLFGKVIWDILLPLYSHALREGDSVAVYERARKNMGSAAGWIVSGFAGGSSVIVAMLYPDSYVDAGWIARILLIGAWFDMLATIDRALLLAAGSAASSASGMALKTVALLIAIPSGFAIGGLPFAIGAVMLSDMVIYVLYSVLATRQGMAGWKLDLAFHTKMAVAIAGSWTLSSVIVGQPALPQLASEVVASAVVFVLCTAIWGKDLWTLIQTIRQRRAGNPEPAA